MMLLPAARPGAGRVSFDQLLQHNARRSPDAPALIDAPDRPLWTEGAPRRLTWAQVDAAAGAVASRLTGLGLMADAAVAIQGPNASDTLIALLACHRANLVPCLMPAGWRRAEATAAIDRIGAKAIFAATRAGPHYPADALRHAAADNFSVRFVCGFGADAPDGVVPFEDCFSDPKGPDIQRSPRLGNPAEHVAAVTFDCGPAGFYPVARSHNEYLAAGLAVLSGLGLGRDGVLLASLSPASFAGLATGLVPWLMSGATLVLHQGFDADIMGVQFERHAVTHAVLPQIVVNAGLRETLLRDHSLAGVVSLCRRSDLPLPPPSPVPITPIAAFGEIGLVPMLRGAAGLRIPLGRVTLPPGVEESPECIETGLTRDGDLALRGPMVPRAAFPGSERASSYPLAGEGWIATGFPAEVEDGALAVSGERRDVICAGGHALPVAAVESLYADMPSALAVSAFAAPDPILGQRVRLEAVPRPEAPLSPVSLIMHAEEKGVSPLAVTADPRIGDRRSPQSLAVVA